MAGHPLAGSRPGSAELPRAARRALRRHRSRAGARPRGHFDHAGALGLVALSAHRVQDGGDSLVRVRIRVRVRVRVRIRVRPTESRMAETACRRRGEYAVGYYGNAHGHERVAIDTRARHTGCELPHRHAHTRGMQ